MKTVAKTLLRIAAFFGAIFAWHAVMPLSICWLAPSQQAACIICGLLAVFAALISYIESE